MNDLDDKIYSVKAQAAKICEEYNVSFIGFFQNPTKNYEKVIVEGIDSTTPNGSFSSSSFNSSTSLEFQNIIANLLNSSKSESSPKSENVASTLDQSIDLASSYKSQKYKMIYVNPHNKVEVKNFLYNCFEEFQQIPCKLLAKAWIKVVEPRKQSKYPYKNGEKSRPFWWPPNCIHREPDHLKKDERINLLIRLIRVFKQRKSELIHTASLITGLGPDKINSLNSTLLQESMNKRKMDLLNDMFTVVESEYDNNIKKVKVIKPGKKYSSQLYQRSKPMMEKKESTKVSTTKYSSSLDTSIKFPSFTTPPLIRDSNSLVKDKNMKLLPPPKFSSSNMTISDSSSIFNDFSNSTTEIDTRNNNRDTQLKKILSSPYTPSKNMCLKYPTPQYTNDPYTQPLINRQELIKMEKSILNPLVNHSYNNTENAIDPNFYENTSSNEKLRGELLTPQNIFLGYNISPPFGTFTLNKGNTNSNALASLSPSRINSLNSTNYETSKNFNKQCLFTTFSVDSNFEKDNKKETKNSKGRNETDNK